MNWEDIINYELNQPYFQQLQQFLTLEYNNYRIFPEKENIFNAFKLTPYENVKVVLLGQDPYHKLGQAHGLSFSVPRGVPIPPSLQNIYKELYNDLGIKKSNNGDLTLWAKQGVLLLNTVLTVREGQANSHSGQGWEIFTDQIIKSLNNHDTPIVYLLLGKQAMEKQKLIDTNCHYIVSAPHPSPLSAYRGFFGSNIFSKVNEILADNDLVPIEF